MPLHPATCPLDCPDACGILVETAEDGRFVRVRGNPDHTYSAGHLCGKTALYGELVTSPDRLLTPLLREGGRLREASWDEALERIAERVGPLEPGEVLSLEYAGNMGQVARQFPLRIMNAIGATLHDGGVCDNTSTDGYEAVLGHVVGCDLEEVGDSDLVLIWGADVARTVQHLLPSLLKLAKAGVPVCVIDVYQTETMKRFEKMGGHGFVIRPGSDAMLALGLARKLYEQGAHDAEFLEAQCSGAEEFRVHATSAHSSAEVAEVTGLTDDALERLASLFAGARRPFVKIGVGWARRRNGMLGMRAVCSLCAVKGCVERTHYESFAHFGLQAEVLTRPDVRPQGAPQTPIRHVAVGEALARGDYRAAFVWGHNPAVTLPDSNRVRAGLARDDLFLVVHESFLTETAELADVVLPSANFVEEWEVTRSYGHRTLQFQSPAVAPPGEAKSNVDTFSSIGKALGVSPELTEVSAEGLCHELLNATRDRFSDEEWRRLHSHEPVKLADSGILHEGRGTPSGKIELVAAHLEPRMACWKPDATVGTGPADEGEFSLIPAPSRATHNSTFAHSSRHVTRDGRARVFMNDADAEERKVVEGDLVRLSNRYGELTLPVELTPDLPRGSLRVDGPLRANEVRERVGVNALVAPNLSQHSGGSTLYSTRVDLEPAR